MKSFQVMMTIVNYVCVCYWPPVRGVCPNYEVVQFEPWTVNPPEYWLRRLLLRIYS